MDVGGAQRAAGAGPAGRASAVEQPLPKVGRDQRGGGERASIQAAAPARRASSSVRGGGSRGAAPRRPRLFQAGADPRAQRRRARLGERRARAGASFGAAARRSGGEQRCGAVGGSAAPGPTALVEPHPRVAGDVAGACQGPSILKEEAAVPPPQGRQPRSWRSVPGRSCRPCSGPSGRGPRCAVRAREKTKPEVPKATPRRKTTRKPRPNP